MKELDEGFKLVLDIWLIHPIKFTSLNFSFMITDYSQLLLSNSVSYHNTLIYHPINHQLRMPKSSNVFPLLEYGDVEIILSRNPSDHVVLHSVVLSLHSSFFKASLSKKWSDLRDEGAKEGPIKWKYQLVFGDGKDSKDDDNLGIPILARAVCEKPYLTVYRQSKKLNIQ